MFFVAFGAACSGKAPEPTTSAGLPASTSSAPSATTKTSLRDVPSPHYELLAGDMHCHVAPPDDASDVSRDIDETLRLAKQESLDFVVLTPHVRARFFLEPELRTAVSEGQAHLRRDIARLSGQGVVFIPGFEYTDHRYGHVGVSFADVDQVLRDVSVEDARAHPARFFEDWIDRGGLLVVNHPFVTPLESMFAIARADLSWRPFTSKGPFPPEIEAIDKRAQAFEVYNVKATDLRDRWLVGDDDHTIRATFDKLDAEIPIEHRRMTPVGGSDSHTDTLEATTFVFATGRAPRDILDGIVSGRVCVRDRAACSFEARSGDGPWRAVGAAFDPGERIEVRAHGDAYCGPPRRQGRRDAAFGRGRVGVCPAQSMLRAPSARRERLFGPDVPPLRRLGPMSTDAA